MPTTLPRAARAGAAMTAMLALAGCAATSAPSPSPTPTPTAERGLEAPTSPSPARPIEGTVVRFATGQASVDVTIGADNPTVRDFLSRLPTTIGFDEFNGREKIGYPEPALTVDGSPGSDPDDGDLIYFAPWGNLGFYYDAAGIDYSDQTIHLGTYDATPEELAAFDGATVAIEVVG